MENKKLIIVLTGDNAVGKTTALSFIKKYLESKNKKCKYYSFAQPLRTYIKKLLYINSDKFDKLKREGDLRDKMIYLANVTKEVFHKDIFIDNVIESIKKSNKEYYIISDLRYINEYEKIKNTFTNGEIIKIIKITKNEDDTKTILGLFESNDIIINNKNLKHYVSEIHKLIDKYLKL